MSKSKMDNHKYDRISNWIPYTTYQELAPLIFGSIPKDWIWAINTQVWKEKYGRSS